LQTAGDLGFADAGAVEFADPTGVSIHGARTAQSFAVQPRFRESGTNPLAQEIVFELRILRRTAICRVRA
jgi:hypothetical protein